MGRHKKCEDCGKEKKDVQETTCPYQQEINEEMIDIQVCDNCYQMRQDEI